MCHAQSPSENAILTVSLPHTVVRTNQSEWMRASKRTNRKQNEATSKQQMKRTSKEVSMRHAQGQVKTPFSLSLTHSRAN